MPDCHRCGAAIEFIEDKQGNRFAVDVYESFQGEGRWVVDLSDGRAEELDAFADAAGQTEHRLTCSTGVDPGDL